MKEIKRDSIIDGKMKLVKKVFLFGIGFGLILTIFFFGPTALFSYQVKLKENRCYKFLQTHLSSQDGAILRKLPLNDPQQVKEGELLSESVGLFMLYAAVIGDRSTFESQYQIVQNLFMGPKGLLYWKINLPSRKPEACSAPLDK